METITKQQAEERGLRVLCGPYKKSQMWMVNNALRTLGTIESALVAVPAGIEIWRTNNGWVEKQDNN
jgi:hypothetical protein